MADTKITDLTVITGSQLNALDVLPVVDVSDTTLAASGTDKKITIANLINFIVSGRDQLGKAW